MNPSEDKMDSESQIHKREIGFHDNWAKSIKPEEVSIHPLFESPLAFENKYILRRMGDLKGKKILDIGCGLGESSVYFALKGAEVTAMDISPEMVNLAERVAVHHGVCIRGVVGTAESLEVENDYFDFVYAANLIHHVTDRSHFFENAARVLKTNGFFCSWDPLAYNPVINAYRKMATEVRSEDEQPLTFDDIHLARQYFSQVRHREFWILTLSIFLKYYFIDGVHPNQERYWKKIYKESPRSLWWWYPARMMDIILTRLPFVKKLAWNTVIVARK